MTALQDLRRLEAHYAPEARDRIEAIRRIDARALQARFDAEGEELAELQAAAEQRELARRVHSGEPLLMRLLLGACAALGLVCLASQILRVLIP